MPATTELQITNIEAWACRIPLPEPFDIGPMHIAHRDFVLCRITLADGAEGSSWVLSRGAPIDIALIEMLAPHLLGADASDIDGILAVCARVTVAIGLDGILGRAVSLIDVALWDLRGKAASAPVWQLLGDARRRVPALVVGGYPRSGEGPVEFGSRMAAIVQGGTSMLKLANVPDVDDMTARIESTRRAVGEEVTLVVDIAWSWPDARTGLQIAEMWAPYDLAWIEDPYPAAMVEEGALLRASSPIPIGIGDEVSDPLLLRRLLDADAVDILRVDALTVGGITGFLRARTAAAEKGVPVSGHVSPEVHRHVAMAFEDVHSVELFPAGSPFLGLDLLIDPGWLQIEDGHVIAPDAPGIGAEPNWVAVEAVAYRRSQHSKENA